MSRLPPLPEKSGAYRWFYADVTAGDLTAVFIFMVGSVFSPRYSASLRKGGLPAHHCAVNFALYERGVRWLWVLSEYGEAEVTANGLRIGASSLEFGPGGRLRAHLADKTPLWGRPAEATLELTPRGPRGPEVALVEGQPHWWQPLAPRASARVTVPQHQLDFTGSGYHDSNHGDEPLGRAFAGWRWTRLHQPSQTLVDYLPTGGAPPLRVRATDSEVTLERGEPGVRPSLRLRSDGQAVSIEHRAPARSTSTGPEGTGLLAPRPSPPAPPSLLVRTGWGLSVPKALEAGGTVLSTRPSLLETSPFYARLEARDKESHALAEVADFRRFHSPCVRWMARLRTRTGALTRGSPP